MGTPFDQFQVGRQSAILRGATAGFHDCLAGGQGGIAMRRPRGGDARVQPHATEESRTVPDQIAGWIEFLQTRVLVNREAMVFASIVFFQVFLAIVNVLILVQVVRALGAMRRALAESRFQVNERTEEILRRLSHDREAFTAIGERLDKVGEERKSKIDERRRILRTLVDGFEATLSQRR
jgi:uncharacterized membrane protein